MKKKYLAGDIIVQKVQEFLDNCSEENLAQLCMILFGGECTPIGDDTYEYTPDESYSNEFEIDNV